MPIISLAFLLNAAKPFLEFRVDGVLMRSELLSPTQMTIKSVRDRGLAFTRDTASKAIVARLVIGTSKLDVALASAMPLGAGLTEKELHSNRKFPIARVTRIRDASVLEFRDLSGQVSTEILMGGRNPAVFPIGHGATCELLHFNAREAATPVRFGPGDAIFIELFMECTAWLAPEAAHSLWRTFAGLFRTETIVLHAANCACFDPPSDFPIGFPFKRRTELSNRLWNAHVYATSGSVWYGSTPPTGEYVERKW